MLNFRVSQQPRLETSGSSFLRSVLAAVLILSGRVSSSPLLVRGQTTFHSTPPLNISSALCREVNHRAQQLLPDCSSFHGNFQLRPGFNSGRDGVLPPRLCCSLWGADKFLAGAPRAGKQQAAEALLCSLVSD